MLSRVAESTRSHKPLSGHASRTQGPSAFRHEGAPVRPRSARPTTQGSRTVTGMAIDPGPAPAAESRRTVTRESAIPTSAGGAPRIVGNLQFCRLGKEFLMDVLDRVEGFDIYRTLALLCLLRAPSIREVAQVLVMQPRFRRSWAMVSPRSRTIDTPTPKGDSGVWPLFARKSVAEREE